MKTCWPYKYSFIGLAADEDSRVRCKMRDNSFSVSREGEDITMYVGDPTHKRMIYGKTPIKLMTPCDDKTIIKQKVTAA